MKKIIINSVLILCAVILAVSVTAVIILQKQQENENPALNQNDVNISEFLLGQAEKAQQKENAVWLVENDDVPFNTGDSSFTSAVKEIVSKQIFDIVYLSSAVFYKAEDSTADYQAQAKKMTDVINYIKSKGKKCAAVFDSTFIKEEYYPLLSLCDRIVISGIDSKTADEINKITAQLKTLLNDKNKKNEVQLMLENDYAQKNSIDFESINSIYLPCLSEDESYRITQWCKLLENTACTVTAGFYFQHKGKPSEVLQAVYAVDSQSKVTARCFSSYKAVSENKSNCFGAVSEFINKGIVYSLAFREMSVVGYNGEAVESSESETVVSFVGSNLFPFVVDGNEYYTDETGSKKITLQLNEGENSIRFTQDSKTFIYKVNYTFEGDLIESVFPEYEIRVSPSEEIEVTVIAYSKCEVVVKLGAQRFSAAAQEKDRPCYTAFTAKIKMPSSFEELSSVGNITVIATHNDKTVQKKGAVIKASEGVTNLSTTQVQDTTLPIYNYVPSIPDSTQQHTQNVITTKPFVYTTVPDDVKDDNTQQLRLAVVSVPYADTWSDASDDDTHIPYYSALCQGTTDYITGETQAYNSDEEKTVEFYQLASGRKVKKGSVQVINGGKLNDNKMSVLQTEGENGTISIKIKTDWKVPYSVDYTGQNYYTAHGKQYNVSSFTANSITITFYHTAFAEGKIETDISDVVSNAQWSVSQSSKTATLTLKLKNQGEYYGSNISYDDSGNMIITVNNKPQNLSGTVIMLDPGHGGKEPGAVGLGSAVLEKDVNLAIAYQAKTALEQKGAMVIMTRYGDDTLTLEQRKVIMRQYKPDLFVAIHSNGSYNTERKGTSTYYYKPFSKDLANNIFEQLVSVYKSSVYPGRVELYNEIAEGTKYYPFSVTRVEECPSVLIEVGYMTNDEECYELIDSENQKQFGIAIANGIEKTVLS